MSRSIHDISQINSLFDYYNATKSDTVNETGKTRAILLSEEGELKVTNHEGREVTFASGELAAGIWHPMAVKRVWNTGTSATMTVKLGI
jgi:hypothetical protein